MYLSYNIVSLSMVSLVLASIVRYTGAFFTVDTEAVCAIVFLPLSFYVYMYLNIHLFIYL